LLLLVLAEVADEEGWSCLHRSLDNYLDYVENSARTLELD
jgi:hypothetical protein